MARLARPQVALFTRAWIETGSLGVARIAHTSPSSRGRGLKPGLGVLEICPDAVALFTRAWIETRTARAGCNCC